MRALAALALGLAAAAALADDAPPPAADSIAAAKKDFAEIKGAPGSQDLGASLPTIDVKDLNTLPGAHIDAPPVPGTEKDSLDPTKKKEGTGNWLVDAMDKQNAQSQSRDPKAKEKDEQLKADLELLRGDDKKADKDLVALDEPREKEAQREEPEKVYNPLDSFMTSWVSAKDRELLAPKTETGVHADALPGLDGAQEQANDVLVPAAAEVQSLSFVSGANPYVAALELPAEAPVRPLGPMEVADFGSAALPDLSRGMSSAPEARPADELHGFIPDFAMPSDDDKYFKQLKKF